MGNKGLIIVGIVLLLSLGFLCFLISMINKQTEFNNFYYLYKDISAETDGSKVIVHLSGITDALNTKINDLLMNISKQQVKAAIITGCTGQVNMGVGICCANKVSLTDYESTPLGVTNQPTESFSTYWYENGTLKEGIDNPYPQAPRIIRVAIENISSNKDVIESELENSIKSFLISNGATGVSVDVEITGIRKLGRVVPEGRKERNYFIIYNYTSGTKTWDPADSCAVCNQIQNEVAPPLADQSYCERHVPGYAWMNVTYSLGECCNNCSFNWCVNLSQVSHTCYDSNWNVIPCSEIELRSDTIHRKTLMLDHNISVSASFQANVSIKQLILYKKLDKGFFDVDVHASYTYDGHFYNQKFYKRVILSPLKIENTEEVASKNLVSKTRYTYEVREYAKIIVDNDRLLPDAYEVTPNPETYVLTSLYYVESEVGGSGTNYIDTSEMYGGGVCLL